MCTVGGDNRFVPKFDIRPSLVVNSNAVLDATRGQLGLAGEQNERAFSFRRTIAAILDSVPPEVSSGPSDAAAQEAFVKTLIDSFQVPTGQALNAQAGILMPLDDRTEAAELNAKDLLDEISPTGMPTGMKPLALFNRFDLAPDNWSHCGEYRIVYGRERPDPTNPFDRFLMIFEARVQNPGNGPEGCRRVAEFWAGLTGLNEVDQAKKLSAFYYEGKTDHADGDLVFPVVNFRNYGGDGNRGQVRANAFMQQPWQLREWLTQLTFAQSGPKLAFVPVTVKDNPLAQLYRDDLSGDAELANGNIAAAVTSLHGAFIEALTSTIGPRLLSESTPQHQTLANGLENYDLGAAPPIDESTVLLQTIALANTDKFNEHQSTSQGGVDVPGEPAGSSVAVAALLDQVGATPGSQINAQSGQTLLNRARAGTCGGCHMTAARSTGGFFNGPGVIVRENGDGSVVRWPDVAGGFVHVLETDRSLSPALETAFLPVRRYIMARFLCETLGVEAPVEPEPQPVPEPYALLLAQRSLPTGSVTQGGRYLDEIIGDYAQEIAPQPTAAADVTAVRSTMQAMSPGERYALRARVSSAIDAARAIEQQRPGAFVETRRPH
jgi:hypothetical protein